MVKCLCDQTSLASQSTDFFSLAVALQVSSLASQKLPPLSRVSWMFPSWFIVIKIKQDSMNEGLGPEPSTHSLW